MKKLNLHKVIATIICLVGFPMWLGQYTRDHGDSTLMALLILVMISETIWGLWKRKINLNSNFEEDRIAPLWKRILACIADYLLINICSIAISLLTGTYSYDHYEFSILDIAVGPYYNPLILFVYFLYFGLLEASPLQATLGKLMFKIQVHNTNGGRISYSQSFYRQLGKMNELVGVVFYALIDLCSVCIRKDKKCFHDIIGDSIVINKQ